jgi:death-on-curing protein
VKYLNIDEVFELYRMITQETGGLIGLRNKGALESALAQPQMTFGGEELYSGITEKAAALCFFIVKNHPFVDGNKRLGHAAMEVFLLLNGYEISSDVNEQEKAILNLASGDLTLEAFTEWLKKIIIKRKK